MHTQHVRCVNFKILKVHLSFWCFHYCTTVVVVVKKSSTCLREKWTFEGLSTLATEWKWKESQENWPAIASAIVVQSLSGLFFLISNFACFAARPCASIKAKATPSWSESHHASMKIMNLWWLTLLVRPLSCICLAYITTTSSSLAKRLLTECLSGLHMKEEEEEERKTRRILHLMPYHNGKVHY